MSANVEKKSKKNVLDYGMEWFDYHLTVGVYLSIIISVLLFIFVFLGQFYRGETYVLYPALKVLDTVMWIFYLAYTVGLFLTRKLFMAEDKRSFSLFLIIFAIRAIVHAFIAFYIMVVVKGVTDASIFYQYINYFAIVTAVVNVFNIIYFIKRKAIFDYE